MIPPCLGGSLFRVSQDKLWWDFLDRLSRDSAAFLVSDSSGVFIDGDAKSFPCPEPQVAEIHAIKLACEWAVGSSSSPIFIESDFRRVVEALVAPSPIPPLPGDSILRCIWLILLWHPQVSLGYCRRNSNKAAHWLAVNTKVAKLPFDWRWKSPQGFLSILEADHCPSSIRGFGGVYFPVSCLVLSFVCVSVCTRPKKKKYKNMN